jgi:hypothetical protein
MAMGKRKRHRRLHCESTRRGCHPPVILVNLLRGEQEEPL